MIKNIINLLSQININPDDLDIPQAAPTDATVDVIINAVFTILGGVALIIIVLAGMKFSLSRGNPDAAGKARSTIIYAAVGLVIAALAYPIVRYVVRTI